VNRYREIIPEEVQHRPPREILAELTKLEGEIKEGLREVEAMVS
jgi:type I restriction enzyme M protein